MFKGLCKRTRHWDKAFTTSDTQRLQKAKAERDSITFDKSYKYIFITIHVRETSIDHDK